MTTSHNPVPAVIAVVLDGDHVALVLRRNRPHAQSWGFPGGKINWGEPVFAAAERELLEETSLHAQATKVLTTIDVILDEFHFVLVAVLCHLTSGVITAADDADDAEWIPVAHVFDGNLAMAPNTADVLRLAYEAD